MSKKVKLICNHCGNEFFRLPCHSFRKYCSLSCRNIATGQKAKIRLSKKWLNIICLTCNKTFKVMPYRKDAKFCSKECMYKFRKTQYLASNSILYKNGKWSYRRLAFNKFEHKCSICKTTKGQLDVHHIDKDRTNNSLNNLIIVCAKCHKTFHPR